MSNSQSVSTSSSASSQGQPDLSILVPCYGRGPQLGNLLAGLAKQTLATERFEVIVVDDGTPEPIEIAHADYPFRIHLERQANAGPGAARNKGLEFCTAPLVLILNDDAVPAEDLLETHLNVHAEAPDRCAVLGSFHFTEAAREYPFVRILDDSDLLFAFDTLEHNALHPWQYFWTCNLSLPVAAIREVGGFDAENFDEAIVEDVELGYRLEKRGWKVLYREDAVCHHDHVLTPAGYLQRGIRLGFYLERMRAKHQDPTLLYSSSNEGVDKLHGSCVEVVTQYQPVLENLIRGLESLEDEYMGCDPPLELREKAVQFIRQFFGVTIRHGIHLERTGVDLVKAANEGPSQGGLTSIVIASLNSLSKTKRCIETILARRESGFPIELIVIDNGSTDGSAEWLAEQSEIKFIRNEENLGAPRARNQGLALARGEWVAFFDNDVYVTQKWLSKALYHGFVDPEVGAVCLVANRASKHQQVPYEGDSTERSIELFAAERSAKLHRRGQETDLFTSFGIVVRREAIEKIGGFDEAFSPWGFEDDDYSLRLRLAGYRSRVALDVFVYHDHYHDAAKEQRHADLLRRNWERFATKWGKGETPKMYDYDALGLDLAARPPLEQLLVPIELPEVALRAAMVLGTEAKERVLAWPRYDCDEDLERLGQEFGKALLKNDDVCLCLRYDQELDGDMESAIARIEAAMGSLFNEGSGLEVLLVDNDLSHGELERLGRAVHCVIGFSDSLDEARSAFMSGLGVAVVETPDAMESELARSAGTPLSALALS